MVLIKFNFSSKEISQRMVPIERNHLDNEMELNRLITNDHFVKNVKSIVLGESIQKTKLLMFHDQLVE